MDYTLFLPRRLSQAGCVIAGTKLAAHHAALQQDLEDPKPPLASKVESSILAIDNHTRSIAALPTSDAVMIEIDRGADRSSPRSTTSSRASSGPSTTPPSCR